MVKISVMNKISMEYLTFTDLQTLRNCCMSLHEYTKDLRLTWRIFPPPRRAVINCVVSLFVNWASLDRDADRDGRPLSSKVPLVDERGDKICRRYLNMQCFDTTCALNHSSLAFSRSDLAAMGAFLEQKDFSYFVGVVFESAFVWKFEKYIDALFAAYSQPRKIALAKVIFFPIQYFAGHFERSMWCSCRLSLRVERRKN